MNRGSRCTTSAACPWKVTVGNKPRNGATAPSLSHRNRTPSTPTPPTSRPGSNSTHSSLKNPPETSPALGRGPPIHRKPKPGRASSMSSTSASRSRPPASSSSQHNAAAVTASSAARSAVKAARPPRPAHNTNTVNNTNTGTTNTNSNDTVPHSSRRHRPRTDPPPKDRHHNPRPQVEVEGCGLSVRAASTTRPSGSEPGPTARTTARPAQPDSGVRPTDWASFLESGSPAPPAHTGWPCSLNTTN